VVDLLTTLPLDLVLRPATDGDRDLLRAIYSSTRTEELSIVPWSDADKVSFLAMQFEAQDAYYRLAYPEARFLVVERAGHPIGRLYVARLKDEIRIIDVALLPAHRGSGVGTALLRTVLAEADAAGLPVRLHVEPWNPARRLYERFGFRTVEAGPVYELMECAAPPIS
jgi:ribosomal protein S18 acetylase RimI-like enzyme